MDGAAAQPPPAPSSASGRHQRYSPAHLMQAVATPPPAPSRRQPPGSLGRCDVVLLRTVPLHLVAPPLQVNGAAKSSARQGRPDGGPNPHKPRDGVGAAPARAYACSTPHPNPRPSYLQQGGALNGHGPQRCDPTAECFLSPNRCYQADALYS
jgi:hypothetical protein